MGHSVQQQTIVHLVMVWKFSGGFRVNNNSASLHAEPTEDIVIGNQIMQQRTLPIDGSISFDKIAPVATVGYSKVLGKGLTLPK